MKLVPLVETVEPGMGFSYVDNRPYRTDADFIAAAARVTGTFREMAVALDDHIACKAGMCHLCNTPNDALFEGLREEWETALLLYGVDHDPTIRL